MDRVEGLLVRNPAVVLSVLVLAAGAIAGLTGAPEFALVLLVVAGSLLGLHAQVITKTVATETAIKAANDAATTTAANLTVQTVGKLGEVTEAANMVARDAAGLVTGLLEARNPISRTLTK